MSDDDARQSTDDRLIALEAMSEVHEHNIRTLFSDFERLRGPTQAREKLEEVNALLDDAQHDRVGDSSAIATLGLALRLVISYLEREVAPDRQEPPPTPTPTQEPERPIVFWALHPETPKTLAKRYDINAAALIERIEDYLDQKSISSPAAADSFRLLGYEPEFVRELLIGLGLG